MDYGEYIKRYRKMAGISRRDLASEIGVSRPLPEQRWGDIIKVLPGVTLEELCKRSNNPFLVCLSMSCMVSIDPNAGEVFCKSSEGECFRLKLDEGDTWEDMFRVLSGHLKRDK